MTMGVMIILLRWGVVMRENFSLPLGDWEERVAIGILR